jgi:hypothetical protein
MTIIENLLSKPPEEIAKIIKQLKQWIKNRNEMNSNFDAAKHEEFIRQNKAGGAWTKEKTMKKKYSIPMEVYLSNPQYWDEIIATKKFNKHPEWLIK